MNKWSRCHDKCLKCGTTRIMHLAKGLCINCYQNKYYWEKKYKKNGGDTMENLTIGYSASKVSKEKCQKDKILEFAKQLHSLGVKEDWQAAIGGSATYILGWLKMFKLINPESTKLNKSLEKDLNELLKIINKE